jgi:hypothetical protein
MRKFANLDSVLGRHPRRRLIGKEFLFFFTLILLPTPPIRVLNLSRYVFYPRALFVLMYSVCQFVSFLLWVILVDLYCRIVELV